ncbi:type-F conjugative transfer system pilin assembly protein TraF [Legionella septentrionalis]|uniref:type-F conjugative transfer system pilin assembly protein TraF n=1 Tax=Legionella septentrionalis TaxID=2498109 RepID=UPI000F8E7546|nr:type-F conjugative transfer system pilin assembly protein TraF [Legionella septentrionalis]RUR10013.1 type-F conjugative transfer system pilin assembly protein TraF [Legionella septentrionalis]
MTRVILMVFLLLNGVAFADKPVGFLWYTKEKEKKIVESRQPNGIPFESLSYTERDAVLRFYTMEALHKARHTKKLEDMRVFLSLQDYWLKESSRFKSLFQQTMLAYPEYDYAVTHPTSNLGAKITDSVRESQTVEVINHLSKSHGLLFFYRGKSPYDVKQIPIIVDFCKRFRIQLMPVNVDGATSPELLNSRMDQGQANRLGVRYFPALLLVNPASLRVSPVAYGLTTQDVLMERIKQVANQFKGEE